MKANGDEEDGCGAQGDASPAHVVIALHGVAADYTSVIINCDLRVV
jgi:hypothetical protein